MMRVLLAAALGLTMRGAPGQRSIVGAVSLSFTLAPTVALEVDERGGMLVAASQGAELEAVVFRGPVTVRAFGDELEARGGTVLVLHATGGAMLAARGAP